MGYSAERKGSRAIPIAGLVLALLIALTNTNSPAQMMEGRPHGDRTMEGVGLGIGLGLAIGGAIQQQQKDNPPKGPADTAKNPPKTKKDISQQKQKKDTPPSGKPAAPPPSQAQSPQPPAKPEAPVAKQADPSPDPKLVAPCSDCADIAARVARLVKQIEDDVARVNDIARERDNLAEELKGYERGVVEAVEQPDKVYYAKMTALTQDSIRSHEDMIVQAKLKIEQQIDLLRREEARLKECTDKNCPRAIAGPPLTTPPVTLQPPLPPVTLNPQPPEPPVTRPPVQVAQTPPGPPTARGPNEPPPGPGNEPKNEPKADPKDDPKTAEETGPVCGADITENVLTVLRDIHDKFNNAWTPSDAAAACHALINPYYALSAWDIGELNPTSASTNFTKIFAGNDCGQPRDVCGNTVEFMGTCQHPQVVNYVQWGTMLELCSTIWGGGVFSGPAQDLHAKRNWVNWALSLGKNIDRTTGQTNMMEIGKRYARSLSEKYPGGRMPAGVADGLAKQLQQWEKSDARPEQACTRLCRSPSARKVLSDFPFHYTWEPNVPRDGK
ncbi:hypothetical protein ES707_19721 [subsurface metagenome]